MIYSISIFVHEEKGGLLPHLRAHGLHGEQLLRGVHSALSQRPQMRQRPLVPLVLVSLRARRVEPAPKLTGAQEMLHFPTHEHEVDVALALQPGRDVHHGVADGAVARIPRFHGVADGAAFAADVEDGAANGRVDVLGRARLRELQF